MPPPPDRPPRPLARLALGPLTARRPGTAIAVATLAVTLAGGILVAVFDRRDFPTLGQGMWFAVQTVTTVGYGDVTPRSTVGRLIGTVVMVTGIGFLSVVTAAITAAFVESARQRLGTARPEPVADELRAIREQLQRIERRLDER